MLDTLSKSIIGAYFVALLLTNSVARIRDKNWKLHYNGMLAVTIALATTWLGLFGINSWSSYGFLVVALVNIFGSYRTTAQSTEHRSVSALLTTLEIIIGIFFGVTYGWVATKS